MRSSNSADERSLEEIRHALSDRLRKRLPPIEDAVFERVRSISETVAPTDPEYLAGVRKAVRENIDYALTGIETGTKVTEAIPVAASAQARRAARTGMPLDSVLRRYHAGDRRLSELILAEASDLPWEALQEILRTLGPIVDHLTEVISSEYMHEMERSRQSPAQRLGERVRALLDGDRDKDPTLPYELAHWHIGLIVTGTGVEELIRRLAKQVDCQSLCVPAAGGDSTWAWLGSRGRISMAEVEEFLRRYAHEGVTVSLGEVRYGIAGWRLTHQEAQAALRVSLYRPEPLTRCRDVILISAVVRDPVLTASLIETYLAPLDGRRESGTVLRRTLRAYFRADRNAATASRALGIARHTVERHVRSVEEKLGQPLDTCYAQLQVALEAEELVSPDRRD